ncbi:MAG: hypothetical protein IKD61_07680 [Oscillospiraceae bacterium]|nr:hypothetical protein [Oscillospiraceae bacterium]
MKMLHMPSRFRQPVFRLPLWERQKKEEKEKTGAAFHCIGLLFYHSALSFSSAFRKAKRAAL